MAKVNYEAIINDAAEKLEARYAEIEQELAPLRDEQREVAEAIKRIVGSYPSGYTGNGRSTASARRATRTRTTMSEEDREGATVEFINSHPEGVNGKQVGEHLGLSPATAGKTITALIDDGRIRAEGKKAGRKLYPA